MRLGRPDSSSVGAAQPQEVLRNGSHSLRGPLNGLPFEPVGAFGWF